VRRSRYWRRCAKTFGARARHAKVLGHRIEKFFNYLILFIIL